MTAEIVGWSALVRDPRVVAGKGVALFTFGLYRGQVIINYDLVFKKPKSDIVIEAAAVVGTLLLSICILLWLYRRFRGWRFRVTLRHKALLHGKRPSQYDARYLLAVAVGFGIPTALFIVTPSDYQRNVLDTFVTLLVTEWIAAYLACPPDQDDGWGGDEMQDDEPDPSDKEDLSRDKIR